MADSSLCGPANPLKAFQSHAQADQTEQRARFARQQLSPHAFRSTDAHTAGLLDEEYAAFQAGLTSLPADPFYGAERPPVFATPPPPALNDWAAEFQRLQMSNVGPYLDGVWPSMAEEPSPLANWAADIEHYRQMPNVGLSGQQAGSDASPQYRQQPIWNFDSLKSPQNADLQHIIPFYRGNVETLLSNHGYHMTPEQKQIGLAPPPGQDPVFDRALDQAFQAAMDSRMEIDSIQTTPSGSPYENWDVAYAEAVQERIGADTIAGGEQKPGGEAVDADEFARTAGLLLDSVGDNQSTKFQNSSFLALMRKVRDREVRVQGDKMVDVTDDRDILTPYPRDSSVLSQ
ncbi:MAG: hypothetical protein M1829_003905 [Trizodia sp. TS-e1964]|nr:MAG: hypothetical protein M1829_003905 [Trizodia sp. TS-e1964]